MIGATLVTAVGLGLVWVLRHHSAACRHFVMSAAIVCAAMAPAAERVAPAWHVPGLSIAIPTIESSRTSGIMATPRATGIASDNASPTRDPERLPDAGSPLQFVWLAGVIVSLVLLAAGFLRLAWLAAHAQELTQGPWLELAGTIGRAYGIRRRVALLRTDRTGLLLTWGTLRPKILLPAAAIDWPEERIRVVLAHELAHVRRGDWITQALAQAVRALYWFNPLVWAASRRLRQESEHACDDAVLELGVKGPEYAAHLLELARDARRWGRQGFPGFPAPAMTRPGSLERRVTAMLDTTIKRGPATRRARATTSLLLLASTLLAAGLGAGAQSFASLSGSVVDPTNSVIPRATLVLTNRQTEARYEVRSDQAGRFEFVGLPPGDYLLQAKYPGFAMLTGSVTISGQNLQQNVALQVGSVQEQINVSPKRTDAPAASTAELRPRAIGSDQPKPCTPSDTGGNIRPPMKVKDVRPEYPAAGPADGGEVVLDARIDTEGNVSDVNVRGGAPELAQAAVDAVRQWRFTATLLNCTPVEIPMRVTIAFQPR
jgi:TonB family protein